MLKLAFFVKKCYDKNATNIYGYTKTDQIPFIYENTTGQDAL